MMTLVIFGMFTPSPNALVAITNHNTVSSLQNSAKMSSLKPREPIKQQKVSKHVAEGSLPGKFKGISCG